MTTKSTRSRVSASSNRANCVNASLRELLDRIHERLQLLESLRRR
jgi:hypothetical protein